MDRIDFVVIYLTENEESTSKSFIGRNYYNKDGIRLFLKEVEQFCPWVERIYLITDDNDLYDLAAEDKVHIVLLSEILTEEEAEYPNINTIELNIHKIRDLAEHFVYFSPGTYIIRPTEKELFFEKSLPCYHVQTDFVCDDNRMRRNIMINTLLFLSRHFNRHHVLKNTGKQMYSMHNIEASFWNLYFSFIKRESFFGFREDFLPAPMLKSICEDFFRNIGIEDHNSLHYESDFDLNHLVLKYYHYVKGIYRQKRIYQEEARVRTKEELSQKADYKNMKIVFLDSVELNENIASYFGSDKAYKTEKRKDRS